MKPFLSLKIIYQTAVCLILLITACTPKYAVQVNADSITLYYKNNDAKEVLFASSIDRYRLHPAHEVERGVWEVIVPRVEEFTYFYLVDKLPALPDCHSKILDDYGAENCIFVSDM